MVEPKVSKGFLPHAFYQPPVKFKFSEKFSETDKLIVGDFERQNSGTLRLKSLQLISLRRFESPKAYVLDHLPRMDQLSGADVETRKLNSFELVAIGKLESRTALLKSSIGGDEVSDIVLNRNDSELEMAGALRAMNACINCHSARRHELLGAFTYKFALPGSKSSSADEL